MKWVALIAGGGLGAVFRYAASAWIEQAGAAAAAILEAYTTTRTSLIPVPACETNRAEWKAAVDTNWFGFRFPEIIALDGEYFGHFWTQNASLSGTYEANR